MPRVDHLLARRLLGIEMSGIRQMFELAGTDSINMGLGEPDFNPPKNVARALEIAVTKGHNSYGPTLGIPELRRAISDRVKEFRGEDVAPENIIVTAGATQALMLVGQTFVDHGDEVLVPDPGFVLYGPQARICGGFPIPYQCGIETGYLPDPDEIRRLITPRTKILYTNSPSNPTGACMPRSLIEELSEIAHEKDIIIVADEVYDIMSYDAPHESFLAHGDNIIWVNSFSKTYAMTGWRLGCLATKSDYVKAIEKMHYHTIACPPTPLQWAAVEALQGPQDEVDRMVETFRKRRDLIVRLLNEIEGFHCPRPGGAFYAFPSYEHDIPSKEFALRLAKEGLICSPGRAFGAAGEGHLRFSYACSFEEIERGMDILARVAAEIPIKGRRKALA
jgi:aspartate aminotransferase